MTAPRAHIPAIILARGGSRGVPRKNVRPLGGRACVEWTIEHAVRTRSVDPVIVSSDDEAILELARARGVEIDGRPREEAEDGASVACAARGALERWERRTGARARGVVILYANVPVRPTDLTERAIARLLETRCDSVQSYAPVGKHHPWWTARIDEGSGAVRPWEGDRLNHGVHRRQDLPPAWIPDGGVLALLRESLLGEIPGVEPGPHAFLGLDHRAVLTRPGEVVDIDSEVDLAVADALLRARGGAEGSDR